MKARPAQPRCLLRSRLVSRRRIAFRSKRNDNPETYVMNADGSGLRRLTRNPANERWFAWSPDGRKLSFVRDLEIYVVNADGSGDG